MTAPRSKTSYKLEHRALKRALKLAKFLAVLAPENWDYSWLVRKEDEHMTCGTVCCAAGWMPAVDPKIWAWKKYGSDYMSILRPVVRGKEPDGTPTALADAEPYTTDRLAEYFEGLPIPSGPYNSLWAYVNYIFYNALDAIVECYDDDSGECVIVNPQHITILLSQMCLNITPRCNWGDAENKELIDSLVTRVEKKIAKLAAKIKAVA